LFLDLIASYAVKALNRILHFLPMRFSLWLASGLGSLAYVLSGKRQRVTYANLKAAFSSEKSPAEIKRLTKKVYKHLGRTIADIMLLTKVDDRFVEKYVDIINFERIVEAAKNPNGMILVSAHFGSWELSIAASVIKGFPMHIIARDQKMQRVNELFNGMREAKGNVVIRKGLDIKKIFRVLHEGKSLGLLADQNAGSSGELIDFFGRPASTVTGPYRFAQKSGAWVLPAFIHRKKGPYHELVLEQPMKIGEDDDIIPYMEEYSRLLEKHVRDHPDQWFWVHKRWKVTPLRKVMVLDDGKKGHLKQSLAVVKQMRRFREDEGYAPEYIEAEVVRINFRNKARKTVFNALSPFFVNNFQGRMGFLRWALDAESYDNAVNRYADIIVSCGSSLFGVSRMLKIENYARNVTVMDPGPLSRKKFDLVIIPRHDMHKVKGKPKDNLIFTDLAPNLISSGELASFREKIGEGKAFPGKFRLGLLLGGDNPDYTFGNDLLRSLGENVRRSCEARDGYLYMTTSRRTSEGAEAAVKEMLGSYPRCAMYVSGRDDTDDHTVEKIMAASDVIMVSGESISMVSEAVSSGKPVLVFMPDKKVAGPTKYEKFVDDLDRKKYLKVVKPEEIPDRLTDVLERRAEFTVPEDNRRIYEKLYRLF